MKDAIKAEKSFVSEGWIWEIDGKKGGQRVVPITEFEQSPDVALSPSPPFPTNNRSFLHHASVATTGLSAHFPKWLLSSSLSA